MDETHDLALWPILRRLPGELISKLDRFYIFNNGESVLLFCRDCKVYGFGQNVHGMLGVPPEHWRQKWLNLLRFQCTHSQYHPMVEQPTELARLRYRSVVTLSRGEKHMMALTELGELFAWGCNQSGQLGIGWLRPYSFEPSLVLEQVKKVCCGPKHTVALMSDGSIKFWGKYPGCEQCYQPQSVTRIHEPMVDLISTRYLTVTYDNRYDHHDKSAFYAWGDLKLFGLPTPLAASAASTVRLTYKRGDYSRIARIVPLGWCKIMLLSCDGKLSMISIEGQRVRSVKNPFRSVPPVQCCVAMPDDPHLVVLVEADTGHCQIWDEAPGALRPTGLSSVPDTACLYSASYTPHITRIPPRLLEGWRVATSSDQYSFNDPITADLVIRVKAANLKPIYCHRTVLSQHSEYLQQCLLCERNKRAARQQQQQSTIVIEDISYISMYYYLRFVYTGLLQPALDDQGLFCELYHVGCRFQDHRLVQLMAGLLYPSLPPTSI